MSHPPFGLKAGPTQFAPEKPTQPETTVIGSSAPVYALPTQPHPALIQAQNALVESTAESVAIPQTRYLIGLDKEIGGGFRKAAQKEFNNQCDGLIKTMTEFPVELKDSLNFSHIDLVIPAPAQNLSSKC